MIRGQLYNYSVKSGTVDGIGFIPAKKSSPRSLEVVTAQLVIVD